MHLIKKYIKPSIFVCSIVLIIFIIIRQFIQSDNNPDYNKLTSVLEYIITIGGIFVIFLALCFLIVNINKLLKNRHIIWKLAKNDLKKKYAGAYLGTVWALVQPVITIVLYYIIFELILTGATRTNEAPYVLFLTAGFVPWFFFNDAINAGANAFREYDFLVKKVVFDISVLPIIKVLATAFIHLFLIVVLLIVSSIYGFYPTIYTVQIIYYSICLVFLTLSISYFTSSVVVFFKDLSHIIIIVLQVGMWLTPILWDINTIPEKWRIVIKINPLVYIVNGFRSAVYKQEWFIQDPFYTLYFWLFMIVIFYFGKGVFERLKIHFADVL